MSARTSAGQVLRPRVQPNLALLPSVALVLATGLVGACGGGDGPTSDEKRIRSVSTAFNALLLVGLEGRANAKEYRKLCSLSTSKTRVEMARHYKAEFNKSGGCQEWWRAFFTNPRRPSEPERTRLRALIARMKRFEIRSIRVSGDRALVTANTSYIDGEGGPEKLKKEGGKWLIDGTP